LGGAVGEIAQCGSAFFFSVERRAAAPFTFEGMNEGKFAGAQGPGQYQQISKATELVALPPTLADKWTMRLLRSLTAKVTGAE
jgi:hypothetical protein